MHHLIIAGTAGMAGHADTPPPKHVHTYTLTSPCFPRVPAALVAMLVMMTLSLGTVYRGRGWSAIPSPSLRDMDAGCRVGHTPRSTICQHVNNNCWYMICVKYSHMLVSKHAALPGTSNIQFPIQVHGFKDYRMSMCASESIPNEQDRLRMLRARVKNMTVVPRIRLLVVHLPLFPSWSCSFCMALKRLHGASPHLSGGA